MVYKAQIGIMEYVLLTFFILVIIVAVILFFTGWQLFQMDLEKSKEAGDKTLSLTKQFLNTPYMVKENSVFDDGKLTALVSLSDVCKDLEAVFGFDWFLEITIFDNNSRIECVWGNYPDCNFWSLCKKNRTHISYVVPVNVYRKTSERMDLGVLKVGVYS
jgi:hypothetical protein